MLNKCQLGWYLCEVSPTYINYTVCNVVKAIIIYWIISAVPDRVY